VCVSTVISREALHRALEHQRESGALLGEVLLALDLVSERELAQALAHEARVPFLAPESADHRAGELVSERLARRHMVAPLAVQNGTLQVLQANPFDVLAIDDIRRASGCPVEAFAGARSDVSRLLDQIYGTRGRLDDLVEAGITDLRQAAGVRVGDAPIVRLLDLILAAAVDAGATNLHIEPEEEIIRLRHRIDGVLTEYQTLPKALQPALINRVKLMAGMDIAEQRLPQDGHLSQKVGGRRVELRVATFPTTHGEKVAVRLLDGARMVRGLADLGLGRKNLKLFHGLLAKSRGFVLVTGPTGAGKTTTLYSALAHLVAAQRNILTVEDPVEYVLPGIRQTQVRPKAGLTVATAVRAALRQDPDVIMIGEIRDGETAGLAVRAALSGVLVFSTLHTTDACGALPRLLDMGVEPYLLASSIEGIVSQRLIRLLCPDCREQVQPAAEILEKTGLVSEHGFMFFGGRGCAGCKGTGYRGRTGVFEILSLNESTRELVRKRADSPLIREAAFPGGRRTLAADALARALFGQTTLDEVLRAADESGARPDLTGAF
jgi:type IV pilus assembly protein PilB